MSKTRKWGSSLGLIIPKRIVEKLQLQENQEVIFEIQPKTSVLKEMFGVGKGKTKKKTEQIIQEARIELGVD